MGTNNDNDHWNLPYEFSSWTRLLRVTAYVLRFVAYLRNKPRRPQGVSLSTEEIIAARNYWIRSVQAELFPQELLALKNKRAVAPKSPLYKLNPSLDQANIPNSAWRAVTPIHTLTRCEIPCDVAQTSCERPLDPTHTPPNVEWWSTINAENTARAILGYTCALFSQSLQSHSIYARIRCVRERAAVPSQLMGDLPAVRVTPARPFSHTGIDYAGPLLVRVAPGRGYRTQKCYIALFVCLAIRVIHLELVTDCSTAEFLAAFDRFTARR